MVKYIDFDWNEVNLYDKDLNKVAMEANLVLHDLLSNEVLFIGNDAKNNLNIDKNILSVVPIENRKINSLEDFKIMIDFLVKKYSLKNFLIVDRYNASNLKNFDFISEKDFIKLKFNAGYFIDLRNNETIIYDLDNNKIDVILKGKYFLTKSLNEYFIKNFNATLNTKKLLNLLENLTSTDLKNLSIRNYENGEDFVVEIKQNELLKILKDFDNFVKKVLDKNKLINYSSNYEKVFKFLW